MKGAKETKWPATVYNSWDIKILIFIEITRFLTSAILLTVGYSILYWDPRNHEMKQMFDHYDVKSISYDLLTTFMFSWNIFGGVFSALYIQSTFKLRKDSILPYVYASYVLITLTAVLVAYGYIILTDLRTGLPDLLIAIIPRNALYTLFGLCGLTYLAELIFIAMMEEEASEFIANHFKQTKILQKPVVTKEINEKMLNEKIALDV